MADCCFVARESKTGLVGFQFNTGLKTHLRHQMFLARLFQELADEAFASQYGHLLKLGDNIDSVDVPNTFRNFLKALEECQGEEPTQRMREQMAAAKTAVIEGNQPAEIKQRLLKYITEHNVKDEDFSPAPTGRDRDHDRNEYNRALDEFVEYSRFVQQLELQLDSDNPSDKQLADYSAAIAENKKLWLQLLDARNTRFGGEHEQLDVEDNAVPSVAAAPGTRTSKRDRQDLDTPQQAPELGHGTRFMRGPARKQFIPKENTVKALFQPKDDSSNNIDGNGDPESTTLSPGKRFEPTSSSKLGHPGEGSSRNFREVHSEAENAGETRDRKLHGAEGKGAVQPSHGVTEHVSMNNRHNKLGNEDGDQPSNAVADHMPTLAGDSQPRDIIHSPPRKLNIWTPHQGNDDVDHPFNAADDHVPTLAGGNQPRNNNIVPPPSPTSKRNIWTPQQN